MSIQFDSHASRLAACGCVRPTDNTPLASLIDNAVTELEFHRQHADLCGLRHLPLEIPLNRLHHEADDYEAEPDDECGPRIQVACCQQ